MKKSRITPADELKIYEAMEIMATKNLLILYLRAVKEMTYKEIAARVGMTIEGVRRRLIAIRKDIQKNAVSK